MGRSASKIDQGQPGLLLDRDGVLNAERGTYTYRKADLQLLEGVPEQLKRFCDAGFVLVIVSNQSGIAKGIYGHEEVMELDAYLRTILAEKGVNIAGTFYCPHHPSVGHCLCRKPGSLMVERALAKFALDPGRTWMVGDRDRDVEAGTRAGIEAVKIQSNSSLEQVTWIREKVEHGER